MYKKLNDRVLCEKYLMKYLLELIFYDFYMYIKNAVSINISILISIARSILYEKL